jgi:HK97 family phage prohead protease
MEKEPTLQSKSDLPISYKGNSLKFDRPQSETRTVKGYFASFDTLDSDMDIIRKGAFAKSIEERGTLSASNRKIKYLHQHNPLELCGSLLELREDDFGLYFEGQIERTPLGDVILERYSNGTYREHSIGFRYVQSGCNYTSMPIPDHPELPSIQVFECKELNLFEGSVVTFGANSETPFVGFKGSKEDFEKQLQEELKFLLKHAPNYEYELQIRKLYHNQQTLFKSMVAKSTKDEAKPKEETGIDFNYLINNL